MPYQRFDYGIARLPAATPQHPAFIANRRSYRGQLTDPANARLLLMTISPDLGGCDGMVASAEFALIGTLVTVRHRGVAMNCRRHQRSPAIGLAFSLRRPVRQLV